MAVKLSLNARTRELLVVVGTESIPSETTKDRMHVRLAHAYGRCFDPCWNDPAAIGKWQNTMDGWCVPPPARARPRWGDAVILVSNRLPVTVTRRQGRLQFEPSPGGLAVGLEAFYREHDARWVG